MPKLINTILIQIALLCYNNCHANNEELNLSDFTYKNLQKYDQIDNHDGTIYRLDYNGNKVYPTYEGHKCYDFQTKVKFIKYHCETLSNMESGGNLVVKTVTNASNHTYVISNTNNIPNTKEEKFLSISIPANTNIIIPEDVIVTQNDVTFYTVGDNINFFILGGLNNNLEYEYGNALFYFGTRNCNVFVGPKSTVDFNNIQHDSLFCIEDTLLSSSVILYQGCNLQTHSILKDVEKENNTINNQCKLYLNRYSKPDDILCHDHNNKEYHLTKLNGIISPMLNIIYPVQSSQNSDLKDNYKLEYISNNGFSITVKTNYFPGLYWKIESVGHKFSNDNIAGNYCIEDPFPTISFTDNNVATINPKNKFAKYDIQLLDDCLVESGKYSFKQFINVQSNTDKYIDVDTIEDLFMNGRTYQANHKYGKGLLNNMPSDIYPGLIGNKDVVINYNNNSTCTIHGNIVNYQGKLLCMPGISKIIFNSAILSEIISKQKFKYTLVNNNVLESKQEQFGQDITEIIVNNNQYTPYNNNSNHFYNIFCDDENEPFIDYRDEVPSINNYNTNDITWNLSNYTDNNKKNINKFEECFKDGDIYKPQGSNKNGLVNNIPIDFLNYAIKANLSGDVPITIYSNNKQGHVTFSGNNTKYTGVVSLSPNIKSVYFKGDNSVLKINTSIYKETSINDNILQSIINYYDHKLNFFYDNGFDTKLIDESTNIKLSNVTTKVNDNRDTMQNIGKYNVFGITWNTDTIEDCFKDGKGLLNNFPGIIKVNIIGSKNIIINNNKIIKLLGSNSGYTGKITIPESTTEIYRSEKFNTNSIVNIGSTPVYTESNPIIEEINDDIMRNNDTIELDITGKNWKNDKFLLKDVDSGNPYKIVIKGDNKCFNEIILNVNNNQNIILSEKNGVREIIIDKMKLSYDTNNN